MPTDLRSLRAAVLVSLVAAAIVLPTLGQRIVTTSDEARFLLLTRDMLARGTWFEAYVRDRQYRNKPPLYPWAIGALARARGALTEGVGQAPVALAAIGTVFFTVLFGRVLFDLRVGVVAGLVLATSWGFVRHAQLLLPDMLVLCFATAAGVALWRALTTQARGPLVAFWAAVGLAVFAKGPIGLLPVLAGGIWVWWRHGRGEIRRLVSPLGLTLFAGITLLWLVPFLLLGGQTFGTTVLWKDWLAWFIGVPRPHRMLNLVFDALKGFLPWTLLLPLAVPWIRREWRDPALSFATLWSAIPLGIMTFAANPMERYALTFYPGAAVVTAWWLDRHGETVTRAGRVVAGAALATAAVGALLLLAPPWFGALDFPFVAPLSWPAAILAAAAALFGLAFFHGLRQGRPRPLVAGAVLAMGVALGYGGALHVGWENRQEDFRGLAALLERHAAGADTRVFGGRYYQVEFYLGRPLVQIRTIEDLNEYLLPPARPVVLIDERGWYNVEDQVSPKIRILDRMTVRRKDMLVIGDR